MQLTAAMGVNRLLVLARLFDIPLLNKTGEENDETDLHINDRQVSETKDFVFRNLKGNFF